MLLLLGLSPKNYGFSTLEHWSLYSLIWDVRLSQINTWTTTTWSNVWVILPNPSWCEFLIGFLIWTPDSKYLHLTTFSKICMTIQWYDNNRGDHDLKSVCIYNILQNMHDFIHVLIFVNVSKCRKSPKLTNIVRLFNLGPLYDACIQ